jgi:hypothetical protein
MDRLDFIERSLFLCDASRLGLALFVVRVGPFVGMTSRILFRFLVVSIIFIVLSRLMPAFRLALSLEVV